MGSQFSSYQFLWDMPLTSDSASFDPYVDGDHFIPCGSMSVSGTSIYTRFPSQSFIRTYEQFNTNKLTVEQFSAANYSVSRSIDKSTNTITLQFYPYVSFYPGRIDSITFGLQYEIEFFLSYGIDWNSHVWTNQQPYLRTGMYINAHSGSPHVNIQTTTASIALNKYIVGDFFYSASDGYYINFDDVSRKVVTLRTQENLGRYTTIENPYNINLDFNTVVTDNFLQTIVGTAGAITGALWRNANWSSGLFMPDSNTVSIYGSQQKFSITSGGLITCGSITASNLTFNKSPISWSINAAPTALDRIALEFRNSNVTIPNYVNITTASLLVVGESASAWINGGVVNNILMYSGTVNFPPTTDGEIRMWSASGASGSNLGYIYVSGSWHTILTGSDSYPTLSNGTY
jgi:hypothetical protein